MDIEFNLTKSVDENAGIYFDLAKKGKRKREGAIKTIAEAQEKLKKLLSEQDKFIAEEEKKQSKKKRTKEWYEKYHWFESSEGFLCIGGRDATSNEIIIKKHLEKDDLVMHTDTPGSPFFIIKNGQKATEATINETAQAVAVHSKAWKQGATTTDVFYVKPEQVSKEAKAGEYMSKGSFMIYGKREFLRPQMEYSIGLVGEQIIGGPVDAIKVKTKDHVTVIIGREKKSDLAKKIKAKLKGGELDEIIAFLPAGGGDLAKESKKIVRDFK